MRASVHVCYRSRGAAYVEVLVIVGVVLVLGVLALTTLGRSSSEHAEKEAACIATFSCSESGGGSGSDVSSMAGGGNTDGSVGPKGAWERATDVAKGFFVDGLWGTAAGIANAIAHPIDTIGAIGQAIAHPIDTATAIKEGMVEAWNENPERTLGAGLFEVVTLPVAATKAAKVAGKADDVAKGADVVADARKVASNDCPGGVCMGGSCFGPGTPVATPDGDRPIESVAPGDLVLARDPETGRTEPHRVARLFVTPEREVLDVALEHDDGSVETLIVTPEHPFWREGEGFVAVSSLDPGDWVRTIDGRVRVRSLGSAPARMTVYNFEVEVAHTYFVGKSAAWVHNACTPTLGDDVLIRRSDGSVSGGRIVGAGADGKVLVEVNAGGVKGYKHVDPKALVRRRDVGDEVQVPRSDGSSSNAKIVARNPDGTVTVEWTENGATYRKTVHESLLKDADSDRTIAPGVAAPARKFGEPYASGTEGYVPDRLFMDWVPPSGVASEGWKMHISTSGANSYEVADRALPILREMEVPHKVMKDPDAYGKMSGGQAGKFITIYPNSPEQAAQVARSLEPRLRGLGEGAPVIPGERPVGQSGMIYVRYGGFTKETVTDPRTGREVADVRGETSPPWVPDPFTGL